MLKQLSNLFLKSFNIPFINKLQSANNEPIKFRNVKDSIPLTDVVYYRFLYAFLHKSKEAITSKINYHCGTNFTRQGYERKSDNISNTFYEHLLLKITNFYNKLKNKNKNNNNNNKSKNNNKNDSKYI